MGKSYYHQNGNENYETYAIEDQVKYSLGMKQTEISNLVLFSCCFDYTNKEVQR